VFTAFGWAIGQMPAAPTPMRGATKMAGGGDEICSEQEGVSSARREVPRRRTSAADRGRGGTAKCLRDTPAADPAAAAPPIEHDAMSGSRHCRLRPYPGPGGAATDRPSTHSKYVADSCISLCASGIKRSRPDEGEATHLMTPPHDGFASVCRPTRLGVWPVARIGSHARPTPGEVGPFCMRCRAPHRRRKLRGTI
jgi:hypothetical protein